jgi:hypothetical protein
LLVGAPAYFARRGRPAHPQDLAGPACLGYAYLPTLDRWRFIHASGEAAVVTPVGAEAQPILGQGDGHGTCHDPFAGTEAPVGGAALHP